MENDISGRVKVNSEKISQTEKRLDKIDIVIEKLRNRLPLWCTFALMALLGAIGWLVK